MKKIFVDTFYWSALLNPRDSFYQEVAEFSSSLTGTRLVTTEEVLVETLNFFSEYGLFIKQKASRFIHDIFADPYIQVIEQSDRSFQSGLTLYERRLDKGYSLTDCISMQAMKQLGITEILTRDRHFIQEGFIVLL
jgi:uncharacterized protein